VSACEVGGCNGAGTVEMGLFYLDPETLNRTDLNRPMRPNMMMCEEHAERFAATCWTRIDTPVGAQTSLSI
jgi:hypothetical protein